jgi:transposase
LANYLKVKKQQQVIALLQLGWSYRRIEAETGVRRETVSRYDRLRHPNAAKVFPGSEGAEGPPDGGFCGPDGSKPAKTFPGSSPNAAKVFAGSEVPPRSAAAAYHEVITAKLDQRLSVQRIWQDLVADYGYGYSYESVKRYVRRLRRATGRVAGVIHSDPGEEGQVDFFRGAPTLHPESGQWRRPWVFRLTLGCSRHGYEEAVWDQKLKTFLRLHERAFGDLGGVPRVIRHDNLKAAVVRACLFDPDVHPVYAAFAEHWGFTPLPTRPHNPRENGKQERSGGYVKDNALKGHRFDSLDEQNAHLRRWNRTIARLRIHGTTRKQVWTHFLEVERAALQPLAPESFALFRSGTRTVHPDGHVEVRGSFYPVPSRLLGREVQVRWDDRMVRVFFQDTLQAAHTRVPAGQYAQSRSDSPITSSQQAYLRKQLGRCERIGDELHAWAAEAIAERGVRAMRLIQGAIALTRKHPREAVCRAARLAREHRLFRYKDLRRLVEQVPQQKRLDLIADHPSIRPLDHYRLEELT